MSSVNVVVLWFNFIRGSILSVVQILFPLFQTHYHQITITRTKEIKFEARIKLNHNSCCKKYHILGRKVVSEVSKLMKFETLSKL